MAWVYICGMNVTQGAMKKAPATRPLSYYTYSSARVHITWNGHVQPVGYFKSATAANRWINDNDFYGNLDRYRIVTPDGVLKPEYDPQPIINFHPGQY